MLRDKSVSHFGTRRCPVRSKRVKPTMVLAMILWVLLWGGYNTGIGLVLSPSFPATHMQLVHGIRAFFPLLAAWIALLTILGGTSLKPQAVGGPIGLLGLFAAVGIVSSVLLSRAPLRASYWAAMYESVVIVLLAVCSDSEALSTLSRVITLNWVIDIIIMLGLLAAIPSFGGGGMVQTQGSPVGVMAYGSTAATGTILGMASTRNTGFARYAGVAALVGLARLWQSKRWNKITWLGVLVAGLAILVLAQGRTETISFLAGALVVLLLRRRRRVVLLGVGTLGLILLGLEGFFQGLWNFGTRNGSFDPTLTGRSGQWMQGLAAFWHSPWVGLGFQADRYYLHGIQLENAFFHALVQTGILGTLAYVAAYALAWFLMIRLYLSPSSKQLPDEIPGVLMFFTVMSFTESIAYYSADWLLLAPVLAYLQVAWWRARATEARSPYTRAPGVNFSRPAWALQRRGVVPGHPFNKASD